MAQPATKRRKLNNEQISDTSDFQDFPPALITNNGLSSTPIKPTVRVKSRKRGFFQKTRTYKPNPNDITIPNHSPLPIISDTSIPLPPPPMDDYSLPIPPPTYHSNNYNNSNSNNYLYEQYEATEDEDDNDNGYLISDEDKMRNICNKLNIRKGIHIGVNLYGFINHLTVYQEIYRLAQMENEDQRNDIIRSYNSNKLRDIKSKIQSSGKTGKKNEMIHGICQKLIEYRKNYLQAQNEQIISSNNNSNIQPIVPPQIMPIPPVEIINDSMEIVIDNRLISEVKRYTGSNGSKCDGCGMTMEQYKQYENIDGDNDDDNDEDYDGFIRQVCDDCKYGVCEYCEVHNSRGTCYCKNKNFGSKYNDDLNQREWFQDGKISIEDREKVNKIIEMENNGN